MGLLGGDGREVGGGEGQGMVLRVGDAAGGQGVQENTWNGVSLAVHDAGGWAPANIYAQWSTLADICGCAGLDWEARWWR